MGDNAMALNSINGWQHVDLIDWTGHGGVSLTFSTRGTTENVIRDMLHNFT